MNTKNLLSLFLVLCITGSYHAQVGHGGQPYNWQDPSDSYNVVSEMLPEIDIAALKAEDEVTEQHKDIPLRFAYAHEVNFNPENSGSWITALNGDKIWRLGIESSGAHSLNVTFDQFELIDGATLFIYNENKSYSIGAFTKENNKESGSLGTAPVRGDKIIIEYREPAEAQTESKLSISHVAHDYKGAFKLAKGFGTSGSCNNNVNCPISAGWDAQVSSVALITLANGTRWCTGAMMANTSGDDTPYFLTADHCIAGQNVTNWVFYFNYESATCSPNVDGALTQSVSGSTVRANTSNSDVALLELSGPPPAIYGVYYNGWNNSDVAATSAVGIHHPDGDIKKFSIENDALTTNGNFWTVNDWDDGTTEPGSSGSPIFDQNKRVVGQLYGGLAACGNNEYDEYGKLSVSWNGASASVRLKDWLDPTNSGDVTNDGYYPGSAGLVDNQKEIDVEIYPNPTQGIFNVKLNTQETTTIKVMSALGEVILIVEASATIEQIDLSSHANGMYFVELSNNSARTVKKINIAD